MFGEEENPGRKTYRRSVSWSASKARNSGLPPLSIARRTVDEWPTAGSDDLGEWSHLPATPGARPIENLEFQLKRDKLAFFDKECSRIADHIYLGSEAVAKNREILNQNGITHVLNCVGFVCPEYFKSDLVYKTLWLQDSPSEDITSILYDVFDYFEEVRDLGGRVLVHCCQGVSRSTSLVIAYLMWRDGQSFEDAFQYVKSARGITNPNMGFACQLLQCQKRVHAVPVSPNSVLRMYRMAPHSPYDPLHLVPKMLSSPGPGGLDSRGAFIIHVPPGIYVWIGRKCGVVMAENARASANQVVRYERVKGPVVVVEEGMEGVDFWDAIESGNSLACDKGREGVGEKRVEAFDVDFEIFHKALSGGVVPPFPLSGAVCETQVPARESGWYRLRQKFASGFMKEFSEGSKLNGDNAQTGISAPSKDHLLSIASPRGLPDSLPCRSYMSSNSRSKPPLPLSNKIKDTYDEIESPESGPSTDSLSPISSPLGSSKCLSPSPSLSSDSFVQVSVSSHCASPDSFSCYSNTSSKSGSKSPLPSPSDGSSLFTFSPASSNWSGSSSPSTIEFKDSFSFKHTSSLPRKVCLPCKGSSPSLAERRGSIPPSLTLLPLVNDPARVSRSMMRSWSFSHYHTQSNMTENGETSKFESEEFYQLSEKAKPSDIELLTAGNECEIGMKFENRLGKIHLESNGLIHSNLDLTHPVLFQWPTIEKVDMFHAGVLDSRSVFLLLSPNVNLGESESKILYLWVGHDAVIEKEQDQQMERDSTSEDRHAYWEKVGSSFLTQMGLPMDTPMQIVQEGKEPMRFLDYFKCFLTPQSKVSCHG